MIPRPFTLPENPFPPSAFHDAYSQCLILEAEARASRVASVEGCPPPIVCARLLGHLLRLAPAGNPQGQLQREIALAYSDHPTLMRLAATYLQNFIRTFKRSSGPTPAPSEHPSRPSFEDAREYTMSMMGECTIDHRSARNHAMTRDNHRCMITGLKDHNQPDGQVAVQTAHIIPQSVNKNIGEHTAKRFQSAGVWSILSMFSRDTIIKDLAGNRIHRLENILSMNIYSHALFDELKLWLKPVEDAPHTYRVCTVTDSIRLVPGGSLPERVTFSTATDLPLPHPEFLALHALCCEVAWMSGAAEYIMDIERRIGDTKVLAKDGSTVGLLIAVLSAVEAH
ncbi:hypothetical protein OG21DRAFT_1423357 [Imleria badia]|nr:hypothetical protein OG21DRAFT_1423357 [Imleria badia]